MNRKRYAALSADLPSVKDVVMAWANKQYESIENSDFYGGPGRPFGRAYALLPVWVGDVSLQEGRDWYDANETTIDYYSKRYGQALSDVFIDDDEAQDGSFMNAGIDWIDDDDESLTGYWVIVTAGALDV